MSKEKLEERVTAIRNNIFNEYRHSKFDPVQAHQDRCALLEIVDELLAMDLDWSAISDRTAREMAAEDALEESDE